jgi:hypothetical protein
LANSGNPGSWTAMQEAKSISSIGYYASPNGNSDIMTLEKIFSDQQAPKFIQNRPIISEEDLTSSTAVMKVLLDRRGLVYYAVARPDVINIASDDSTQTESFDVADMVVKTGETALAKSSPQLPRSMVESMITLKKSYGWDARVKIPENGDPLFFQNTSEMTIDLTDLEPDTVYYAFFVLQGCDENGNGSSNYSDVYVYQFKTNEREVPGVNLSFSSTNGQITDNYHVSLYTTRAEVSDVTYMLVSTTALEGADFLTQYFVAADENGTMSDTQVAANLDPTCSFESLPENVKKMKVIETMQSGKGDQSYFDQYASKELKEQVMHYILGDDPAVQSRYQYTMRDSSIKNWPMHTSTDANTKTLDLSGSMQYDTYYYMLAVAIHSKESTPADGTAYGFRALSSVIKTDPTPPEISGVDAQLTQVGDIENGIGQYYGTITIKFNKPLYYLPTTEKDDHLITAVPVLMFDNRDANGVNANIDLKEDGAVPITQVWEGSMTSKLTFENFASGTWDTVKSKGTATDHMTFTIKKDNPISLSTSDLGGDYLNLFKDGNASSSSSATGKFQVSIRGMLDEKLSILDTSGTKVDDTNLISASYTPFLRITITDLLTNKSTVQDYGKK